MGDPLQRVLHGVLDGVGEVVHGVDAPLVPLPVVVGVVDAVDHRVPHIEITAAQVNFSPKGILTVGKLSCLHPGKEIQRLFNGPIPPGGAGGGRHIPPVLSELLGGQLADIGKSLPDKFYGVVVHLVKVIRGKEKPVIPVIAQPVDVLLNGVHVLHVLLGGVGIVHPQVADAAILFRRTKIDKDGLGVADMEISIGLRREAGMDGHSGVLSPRSNVLINKIMNKILAHDRFHFFRHGSHTPSLLQ